MSEWRKKYKVHPAADAFPMMDDDELQKLGEDIKANGQLEPIITWLADDDLWILIDGRNRLEAMERLGLDYVDSDEYEGDDPVGYIISKNIYRRHLTPSQRALIAAELETLKQGRPGKDASLHVSRAEAAKLLNVSERSVATAATVRGTDEDKAAVKSGEKSVSAVAKDIAARTTPKPEPKPKAKPEPEPRCFGIFGARRVYVQEFVKLAPGDRDAELQELMDEIKNAIGKSLARAA
jgi:ParB-like chromosome segregation protein Spo0J